MAAVPWEAPRASAVVAGRPGSASPPAGGGPRAAAPHEVPAPAPTVPARGAPAPPAGAPPRLWFRRGERLGAGAPLDARAPVAAVSARLKGRPGALVRVRVRVRVRVGPAP
eukprot:scaffold88178_cov33-Phaeocystis_antarctica.AAC.1